MIVFYRDGVGGRREVFERLTCVRWSRQGKGVAEIELSSRSGNIVLSKKSVALENVPVMTKE